MRLYIERPVKENSRSRDSSCRKGAWCKMWSDCWFWEQKGRRRPEFSGRLIVWQQFEKVWR